MMVRCMTYCRGSAIRASTRWPTLADEILSGGAVGAAIAIEIDGEPVVDIWGGHADAAKTVPWSEGTGRSHRTSGHLLA